MEPAVLGSRLASSLMRTLVKKLFVAEGAGAGLVDQPVRVSRLVSFRGEKRTLTPGDVRKIAATLVERAVGAPGERPFPSAEDEAVADALARVLTGLGDLDMDDVQAVRLGYRGLARELLTRSPAAAGRAAGCCWSTGSTRCRRPSVVAPASRSSSCCNGSRTG